MARVWFSVAVLIQIVYGNELLNCDKCIRKGGQWCKELGSDHCGIGESSDDWCPLNREGLPPLPSKPEDKQQEILERRLYIDSPAQIEIPYNSQTELQVNVSIIETSQTEDIKASVHYTDCSGPKCVVTIQAIPGVDFCLSSGGLYEHAYAKVTIDDKEEITIKYHISCACMCSKYVKEYAVDCNNHGNYSCGMCTCNSGWSGVYCEIKNQPIGGSSVPVKVPVPTKGGHINALPNITLPTSCNVEKNTPKCNFRGDYSCGSCKCHSGWSGKLCDVQICSEKRGDIQCTNPVKDDVECSGNGYCGRCDTCVCYTDREGSQYFQEDNYCTDLCMITNNCDTCLINNTLGRCADCSFMYKFAYDEHHTHLKDNYNRSVWVKCNETLNDCYVEYWAMRDDNDVIQIMVQKTCNDVEVAYVSAGPKVPIIMGILGIIAAVAAVGGLLAWKHFNTVPPLPLSDPEYQNIDAEDCTGENPLYKSPMSSFKNPTYGKW